jgi:uncharacterized protein YndB with AHSA1/START domain
MSDHDLEISRYLAVSRAKVWKAWSDPKHIAQWWCPRPWTTQVLKFDFRPGGDFHTFMTGPDGNGGEGTSDNPGCFTEIVEMEKIVWTSMLTGGWRPATPWLAMTGVFLMSDEGEGTRYIARALHRNAEDAKKHDDMGFQEGWGTMVSQTEEYAKSL